MPARDNCEPPVIRALQKAGYNVTDKPYLMRIADERNIYADLRLSHQNDESEIIVVEVKCFARNRPLLDDFYHALGQYLFYRTVLMLMNVSTPLYLAVPEYVLLELFNRISVATTLQVSDVKFVVVDMDAEVITQWQH